MRSSPRFASFFLFALAALPAAHAQRETLPYDDLLYVEKTWPTARKTTTGIRYIIDRPGDGLPPAAGDMVYVLYDGALLDGTTFDHNQDRTHPFRFRVGRGVVIPGWDQILEQMKPGEKRLVIVPPELAYGDRGDAPRIPRGATLRFEIELLKVDRE